MRQPTQEALLYLERQLANGASTLVKSRHALRTAASLVLIDQIFAISEGLKKQTRSTNLDILIILSQYRPLKQLLRTACDLLPSVNQLRPDIAEMVNTEMKTLLALEQVFVEFEKVAKDIEEELKVKELVLKRSNERYAKLAQELAVRNLQTSK